MLNRITTEDIPALIFLFVVIISFFLCWFWIVFKGGAEKLQGKTFLARGVIWPPFSAEKIKRLTTIILALILVSIMIALFK